MQVRHFQRKQARYVDRKEEELSKSEKLLISLSTHFLESKKVREPAIPLDQALLDKIKSRFDVRSEAFQEKCDVCSEPIEFNSHEEGQCSNGHRSLRCSASLRCCFARTLKCKWCGTHYHPDTGKIGASYNKLKNKRFKFMLVQVFQIAFSATDQLFCKTDLFPTEVSSTNREMDLLAFFTSSQLL